MAGDYYIGNPYANTGSGPSCVVRLNTGASRDDTYDLGFGLGAEPGEACQVNGIAVQQDNEVLVGGRFTNFDTETQYQQLIRLHGSVYTGVSEGQNALAALNAWWSAGELRAVVPEGFGDARLNVYTGTGQLLYSHRSGASANSTFAIPLHPVAGLLLVSMVQGNRRLSTKVMVP